MTRILLVAAATISAVVQAAADPQIRLTKRNGQPYIEIERTVSACPDTGVRADTRQKILDVAAAEWAAFDFPRLSFTKNNFRIIPDSLSSNIAATKGGGIAPSLLNVGAMEDDPLVRERIGNYWASLPEAYRAVFEVQNALWQRSAGRAGWAEYWSAAFISYVMCMAGLTSREFVRAEAHRDYIRAAIEARRQGSSDYRFYAYDIREERPAPGDIICAAREDGPRSINSLDDFASNAAHFSYHCDIVVGFDTVNPRRVPGLLFSIGGNVLNAVTMSQVALSGGKLVPVKAPRGRNWFAILKLNAPPGGSFRRVPVAVIDAAREIQRQRMAQ